MACINCGERTARNFEISDRTTDREVGQLCPQCLIDKYGLTILDETWRNAEGCAVCHRDGTFRFQGPGINRTGSGRGDGPHVEYDLDDRSLAFCDEHYHRILDSHRGERRALADGGSESRLEFADRYR